MLEPKTYKATTKSGREISETAKDANTIIDYPSIESACEKIKKTSKEAMKKVAKKLDSIKAGKEALSVNDKTLQPVILEISNHIEKLPEEGKINESVEDALSCALQRHDEIQQQLNEEAEERVNARAASEE